MKMWAALIITVFVMIFMIKILLLRAQIVFRRYSEDICYMFICSEELFTGVE